jgi:HIRAN domain
MKRLFSKVAGVTYGNLQSILATLQGGEPCRIQPEPDNRYDPNALAIYVATADGVKQVGYIPKELAKQLAPLMDGEALTTYVEEVTGGFEIGDDGDIAAYGLRIAIEIPDKDAS